MAQIMRTELRQAGQLPEHPDARIDRPGGQGRSWSFAGKEGLLDSTQLHGYETWPKES